MKKTILNFVTNFMDFISDNPIPFIFAFFASILLFAMAGIFWGITGFIFIFGLLYLRQNAFNPFANKWVRIGGFIVILIWISIHYMMGQ